MARGLGQARLAIPKVNQNPRVQGGRVAPSPGRLGSASAVATAPRTTATTTAQPTNAVPATQSTPTDPFQSAAPAAATHGLFDLPAYTPQAGQPDPRDATYWSNLAKLKFTDEQEYSKGLREQGRADTDYGDALQTAIRDRATQQRGLGEEAIRGNLGASGWLDRNEAEQTGAYTQQRAYASRVKEEEDQGRLAAQNALLQSFGIESSGLLGESAERYAQHAREEAQNAPPELAAQGGGGGGSSGYAPTGAEAGNWAFYANPKDLPGNNAAKQAIAKRKKAR